MKYVVALVALFLCVGAAPLAQQVAAAPSKPKLVVLLSVDQMRGDYVDRFRKQWTKGLQRLISEGAWFRQAEFPYYNTVTCAGHTSISTGTVPAVHGMVLNQWWVENNTRQVNCTDDDDAKLISYGAPVTGRGNSASHIMTTTLSDELRLQLSPAPRVVSISLKARSAIGLGGHRPDVVIWNDEPTGEWVTSTAFAKEAAPFLVDYVAKHPISADIGRVWDRSLPKDQYLYDGSAVGRQKTDLPTSAFPHIVKNAPDAKGPFTDAWESSPFSDAYLNALALTAIDAMKLGRGPGTDYLAISYSGLDKVGHDFGPESHEVQDLLVHLDAEIGKLLDKLDKDVGRGNYVLGLTADHGVAPVPEWIKAQGLDAGRIDTAALARSVDAVLLRELGGGPYRTRLIYNDIYFNDGVYAQLLERRPAMNAVLEAIRKTPGVWRAYRKEELLTTDPMTRAPALSHYDGRSGDIKVLGRAYWITSTDTTTHGTGHRYDTHVPLVLFGQGIKAGEYLDPVAPIDLAPTLAFLSGVTLPDAMGHVLSQSLLHR